MTEINKYTVKNSIFHALSQLDKKKENGYFLKE